MAGFEQFNAWKNTGFDEGKITSALAKTLGIAGNTDGSGVPHYDNVAIDNALRTRFGLSGTDSPDEGDWEDYSRLTDDLLSNIEGANTGGFGSGARGQITDLLRRATGYGNAKTFLEGGTSNPANRLQDMAGVLSAVARNNGSLIDPSWMAANVKAGPGQTPIGSNVTGPAGFGNLYAQIIGRDDNSPSNDPDRFGRNAQFALNWLARSMLGGETARDIQYGLGDKDLSYAGFKHNVRRRLDPIFEGMRGRVPGY